MTFTDDVDPASRPPIKAPHFPRSAYGKPRPLVRPGPDDLATVAIQRVDQAIEIMIDTIAEELYEEFGTDRITEQTCRDAVLNALWFKGMDA